MNKIFRWPIRPAVILIILTGIAYFIQPKDIEVFEYGFQGDFEAGVYNDADSDGNSIIEIDTSSPGQFKVTYELGGAYKHAFTGVYLQRSGSELMNWKGLDEIEVTLSTKNGKQPLLVIEKLLSDGVSTRPFHYTLDVGPGMNTYNIPIQDFKTQSWWFRQNKQVENTTRWKQDSIVSFNIESCRILSPHLEDVIRVKHVALEAKTVWWPIYLMFFYILLELIIISILTLFSSRNEFEISGELEKSSHPFVYYLDNQFQDNQIDAEKLAEHFDTTPIEVNKVIMSETGLDFKNFLNRLRVEKAKEMLVNTEERAYEVARSCGFNNSSGFTQIFKSVTGDTPNKFRKRNRKES